MMLNYDANSVKKNFKTRLGINQLLLVLNKKNGTPMVGSTRTNKDKVVRVVPVISGITTIACFTT